MRINIQTNFPDVAQRLSALGRQAPFVAAVSLTRTAKDVQAAIKAEMQSVFDRPTTYALNGTFLKPATRQNLEARVWVKDNPFGKGTPADRFLLPQIYGGSRGLKGMERILQRNGLMPSGWFAVPAAGAQLDGNGNVKRSQITQILSQLRVQSGAGYESRATGSARSNRTVARQGVTYFALPQVRRGLKPGIYLKRKFALGSAIKPVFIFVQAVQYRPRLRFFEVGQAVADAQFPRHFDAEWAKAVQSARLR
ncbi:hypothetical protein [Massilia sp. Root1485]|uniref:hypothetical protein n=1 Tax=Massilia sp. Root1485 TaxID=1736472 RepID=UPI0006FE7A15|nr:hypothetical protein [Massilia sp. Root1485]KQZ34283.1 hypothetical protein ASD92_08180 [Massilia sp. Root1485]